MAIESNLAGVARVAFSADTGEFNRDVAQAESRYRAATGDMSDAAIKLELANERLRRSLARGPAAAQSQARALLGVRSAERELTQETNRNTLAIDRNQRSLGRMSRGALAGSGAFGGLARSLAFASSGFLGGAGLVYGLRQALSASSNLAEQTNKTRAVFGSASAQVERFAKNALGLANDQALETASSLGALLRPVGVIEKDAARVSIGLTKLGTDLSSFYNTSVADALTAIKSGLVGESEPLRRYGVQLTEARVQALALAQSGKENVKALTAQDKALARVAIIYKDTGLAAGDYARTIGGVANQQREAQKNFRDTSIAIGQTLTPAYQGLLTAVNDYLGNAENQKRIQEQVNDAVKTGEQVVRGLAGAFKIVKGAVEPVIAALGGVENTVKALGLLWAGLKVKAALGFAGTALASRTTSGRMVVDAGVAGRAWDIATRPRNMVVTTVGGGVPGGTGGPILGPNGRPLPSQPPPVSRGRGLLRGVGRLGGGALGLLGLANPVTATGVAFGASFLYNRGERAKEKAKWDALGSAEQRTFLRESGIPESTLRELGWTLKPLPRSNFQFGLEGLTSRTSARPATTAGRGRPPAFGDKGFRTAPSSTSGGTRGGGAGITREQTLQLAIDTASGTPGLADDLREKRALLAYYRGVEKNTKATGDDLFKIKQATINAENAVTQQVEAIEDAAKSAAKERSAKLEKGRQDRKQAAEKRIADRKQAAEERAERRLEGFELGVARAARTPGLTDDLRRQRQLIGELKRRVNVAKKTKDGLLEAESALNAAQDDLDETLKQQVEREGKKRRASEAKLERVYRNTLIDAGFSIRNPNLVRGEGGRRRSEIARGKKKDKDTEGRTALDFNRMSLEFLKRLEDVQSQYGSNIHPTTVVNQTFQSRAPTPDAAEVFRGARYAQFAMRAAMEGQ